MSKEEWSDNTPKGEAGAENGKDSSGQQHSHQETTTSNSTVQRELDHRLLEICNGQLLALGTTVNRLTTAIIVAALVCAGMLFWTYQMQSMFREEMIRRITVLEENQKAQAQETIQALKLTEGYSERASKHVWELKQALKLKFSQERSAEAQDGEM